MRRRNSDETLRALQRAVEESGLRDPALLRRFASALERSQGSVDPIGSAEAVARDLYWSDVRRFARLAKSRRPLVDMGSLPLGNQDRFFEQFLGSRTVGLCVECGGLTTAGDEGDHERVCPACAGLLDDPDERWAFLWTSIFATGRFNGPAGMRQVLAQCAGDAVQWEGGTAELMKASLLEFVRDVRNEFFRLSSPFVHELPYHGQRVEAKQVIDRFPHFRVEEGERGTVIFSDDELVIARMDNWNLGANEWNNEIQWSNDVGPPEEFPGVSTTPRLPFWRDMKAIA
jgi:hypothetical protein